jgi:hypothetical protein
MLLAKAPFLIARGDRHRGEERHVMGEGTGEDRGVAFRHMLMFLMLGGVRASQSCWCALKIGVGGRPAVGGVWSGISAT